MDKPITTYDKIAFVASTHHDAEIARAELAKLYGDIPTEKADVIVALGGDGQMLQTLHRFRESGKPIYGMNRGSVGYLMNEYSLEDLKLRIAHAQRVVIHPLVMEAVDATGKAHRALAINEVSMFRQTFQAAKLRISIDGKVRLPELSGDGVLVATPAGSTAYNFSAHGPILPLNATLLALTPMSPFRPRRWRGALLPDNARIEIAVLEAEKRPVSAVADHFEVRSVVAVRVRMDKASSMTMLFDHSRNMDERVMAEQFGS
jgi:NAD+ kinase